MLNWLQRLWRSRHPEEEEQSAKPPAEDGMLQAADPDAPRRSDAGPASVEKREPVLVRGKLWVNTSETGWELAREQEAPSDPSIHDLCRSLTQPYSAEARCCAAESLGQMGDAATPAIPALLNSAVDVDATVRKAALGALEAIDPCWPQNAETRKAIPDLLAALKSWSPDVQKSALRLLNVIGLPAVPDLSDALLDGEDTLNKVHVIRVLARIGPGAESAIPGLDRALVSQFLHVRIAAAQALTKIGSIPETAIPALVAGLSDRSADARQAMAACLTRAGTAAEPAVPYLLPLLADRNDRVRESAAAALEQIGPKAVPALIEIVQARDAQRLKAWIESMIKVSRWFTPPKVDLVVTEPQEVWKNLSWTAYDIMEERERLEAAQEAALRVLGKLGPAASAAVPTASQALADRNPAIQFAAIQTLGQIGPEARSAIPDLIQKLLHHNESFREAAAEALECIDLNWASDPAVRGVMEVLDKRLGRAGRPGEIAVQGFTVIGTAAVPVLIDALSSTSRVARENAARALGRIGAGAQPAIPALTRVLQDSHPWVQEEAAKALAKIEEQVADTPAGADAGGVNEQ